MRRFRDMGSGALVTTATFDVIVIGAGAAGAGAAAALSSTMRVMLVEQEEQPGYHSTGRSAALFLESYGNAQIRALSRGSRGFFQTPPDGFSAVPLLRPRKSIFIATQSQRQLLDDMAAEPDIARGAYFIDAQTAVQRCPLLRGDAIIGGLAEDDSSDIEVHELLQGYLRLLKARSGRLMISSRVSTLERVGSVWSVGVGRDTYEAPLVVNAAGAWADQVAVMAGLGPLGLVPKRRTAVLVPAPAGLDVDPLPMVIDVAEQFYLKPDAGHLLLSPADETPSDPCDAQPEELDIAIAIDRIQAVMTLDVRRVIHSWAGLRTFAPDKTPVVGFDPRTEGFFWLAGQGGYGIQTAPAMSEFAIGLIVEKRAPNRLVDQGVLAGELAPDRLLGARTREAALP